MLPAAVRKCQCPGRRRSLPGVLAGQPVGDVFVACSLKNERSGYRGLAVGCFPKSRVHVAGPGDGIHHLVVEGIWAS